MGYSEVLRNCQNAISVKAPNTSADEPAARPSSPSVRFTALDAPTMSRKIQSVNMPWLTGNSMVPITEMLRDIPAQFGPSHANATAMSACPPNFVVLFSPRLRRRRSLIRSSAKPTSDIATKVASSRIPVAVQVGRPTCAMT